MTCPADEPGMLPGVRGRGCELQNRVSPWAGVNRDRKDVILATPFDPTLVNMIMITCHDRFWPIATLPQECMSAMPPKADKPEPTRMTGRTSGLILCLLPHYQHRHASVR